MHKSYSQSLAFFEKKTQAKTKQLPGGSFMDTDPSLFPLKNILAPRFGDFSMNFPFFYRVFVGFSHLSITVFQ